MLYPVILPEVSCDWRSTRESALNPAVDVEMQICGSEVGTKPSYIFSNQSKLLLQRPISRATTNMTAIRQVALNEELEVLDRKIEQLLASAGARMQEPVAEIQEILR